MAEWTAPENPSPETILKEARSDRENGRFEDALMKHIWFHRNALKYDPSMVGVRTSFALKDWRDLSLAFPPAQVEFLAERDAAWSRFESDPTDVVALRDWFSFNRQLKETRATADCFLKLDAIESPLASSVYQQVENCLITEGHLAICGKYLKPEAPFQQAVDAYRDSLNLAATRFPDSPLADISHRQFATRTANWVAILAISYRIDEAKKLAAQASAELKVVKYRHLLDEALAGKLPGQPKAL